MDERMRRFIACCVFLVLSAPAYALDKFETYLVQTVLNSHGYDVGEPDGIAGSQTLTAVNEFAKDYGAPENLDKLYHWIRVQSESNAVAITDEIVVQKIKDSVGEFLKDPFSAQYKDLRLLTGPDTKLACGQVNAKNEYGAYTGFRPFMTLLIELSMLDDYTYSSSLQEDGTTAVDMICHSIFPKRTAP